MRAVVSASGWPLRLVRWPGARYSVGAVEVPAGFPAGGRAAGLTGRRAECGVLDRLVEAVQAGESRALVAVGEPGVGKTVLLDYPGPPRIGVPGGARIRRAVGDGAGLAHRPGQPKEYAAADFRAACQRLSISQSMGRPGSALDNAVIESWHSTLEFELRRVEHYATKAAARAGIAAWIEDYNHHRRHSSLGRVSPVDYERSLAGKEPA
jgi:Integrase core domain